MLLLTRQQVERIHGEIEADKSVWIAPVEWPSEAQPPQGCRDAVQVNVGFRRLLIGADGRVLNAGAVLADTEQER